MLNTAVIIEGLLLKLFKGQQLEQRDSGLESQPCYLANVMSQGNTTSVSPM